MVRNDENERVLACQIFTQLPGDEAAKLKVLGYVRQIIMNLGNDEWSEEAQIRIGHASVANVITLFSEDLPAAEVG